ncbi:response regulator [Balneatrix alpica]|uniref:response regulator n=1 Tax=Balneatrix alpica TaxID=75684 RepID=UPI0027397507|nr:response regulator [Balneatrix alpica]
MQKILIVDDALSILNLLEFTLTRAGYQVEKAEQAAQALALAGQQQFDLIITDRSMPGMDGIELTRALRALPNCQFIPILMLTTESALERKQEGKEAGLTGWIVKPFQPQGLLDTVKRLLG